MIENLEKLTSFINLNRDATREFKKSKKIITALSFGIYHNELREITCCGKSA